MGKKWDEMTPDEQAAAMVKINAAMAQTEAAIAAVTNQLEKPWTILRPDDSTIEAHTSEFALLLKKGVIQRTTLMHPAGEDQKFAPAVEWSLLWGAFGVTPWEVSLGGKTFVAAGDRMLQQWAREGRIQPSTAIRDPATAETRRAGDMRILHGHFAGVARAKGGCLSVFAIALGKFLT